MLIAEAAVLIAGLRVGLSIVSVRRALWLLDAGTRDCTGEQAADTTNLARAMAISRLVDTASRYTITSTCLHRSMALWFFLGRRGLTSDLRIGTRRRGAHFEAHAWVEYGGAVVNDGGEPGYAPLTWPRLHPEA